MRRNNRLLTILLAFALCLGLLTGGVLADEGEAVLDIYDEAPLSADGEAVVDVPADEPEAAPDGATGENELPIIIDDPVYDETELDAPALVSVTNTNGGVKLTWKAVEGAAGYRVLRRTGGGEWSVLTSTAATTVTNKKNVVSGTAYTYTVCCLDADGGVISGYDPNGLTITYVAAPKLLGA